VASNSLTDVPEQTHEAMRAAAMRPVSGPAATGVQAAGGGLELPGREKSDADLPIVGVDRAHTHEPIPGEYDATTLTHREPGAMGSAFNGADNVPDAQQASLTDDDRRELIREGGGRDAERRFDKGVR
jgi:hypothetical protein